MNANIFETIAKIIVKNNEHQFKNLDEEHQEITTETLNRMYRQMYTLTVLLKSFLEKEINHGTIEIEEDVFQTFMMYEEAIEFGFSYTEESNTHAGELIARLCIEYIFPNQKMSLNFVQTLAFITQMFILLNIKYCIEEEDILIDDNEEFIECLNMYEFIINNYAEEAEYIELKDISLSTNFPEGVAMNAKEEIVYAIIRHITGNDAEESMKQIQRSAMYIALHSDEVNVLRHLTTQDHSIQNGIAKTFINQNDTIHSVCEYLIDNDVLHEQAEQEIVRTVLHFVCNEDELQPIDNSMEYALIIYDVFQMMRISFVIEDRIELINAMKTVFSFEEHEEYQELIQYINATSGTLSEESTT